MTGYDVKRQAIIVLVGAALFSSTLLKQSQQVLTGASSSEISNSSVGAHGWSCGHASYDVFYCNNGLDCVPHEWKCNGFVNCPDGSDELNCTGGVHCNDTGRWIPDKQVCNGYSNCVDSSDEVSCPCQLAELRCDSGLCVSTAKFCDKSNDCGDWSDEATSCECPVIEFTCELFTNFSNKCVEALSVCDGIVDCIDGSDEFPSRCDISCQSNETRCNSGVSHFNFTPCIDTAHLCDNTINCVDESDEANCTGCELRCLSSKQTWLGYKLRYICNDTIDLCNGLQDCIDSMDESVESCNCSDGIECSLTGRCAVTRSSVECDGVNDCGDVRDWTDECYCSYGDYQVRFCNNTGRCLAPWQICDGIDDCGDASDEQNCTLIESGCEYLSPREFSCKHSNDGSSRCLNVSLVCDGFDDCSNATDERYCHEACGTDEARCATGTSILPGFPICIPVTMWCDGTAQCNDHSDENTILCQGSCVPHPESSTNRCQSFTNSTTYICVAEGSHCDGVTDCYNAVDEMACCSIEQFQCDNSACIPANWLCDNYDDCGDGSDEQNCPDSCDYLCTLEKCIASEQVCDGVEDCDHGLDEDVPFCDIWNGDGGGGGGYNVTYPEYHDTKSSGRVLTTPKQVRWTMATGVIVGGSVCVLLISSIVAVTYVKKYNNGHKRAKTKRNTVRPVGYNAATNATNIRLNHFTSPQQSTPPISSTNRQLSQQQQPPLHPQPSQQQQPPLHPQPSQQQQPPLHPHPSQQQQPPLHLQPSQQQQPPLHPQPSQQQQPPLHPQPSQQQQPPTHSKPSTEPKLSTDLIPLTGPRLSLFTHTSLYPERHAHAQLPTDPQPSMNLRSLPSHSIPTMNVEKGNEVDSKPSAVATTQSVVLSSTAAEGDNLPPSLPSLPSYSSLYHPANLRLPPIQPVYPAQGRLPPLNRHHRQLPPVNTVEGTPDQHFHWT